MLRQAFGWRAAGALLGGCVAIAASAAGPTADAFGERVRQARQAEQAGDVRAYQQQLWNRIGSFTRNVMTRCFPPGVKRDAATIVLVADIAPDASLHAPETRPDTRMARCFVDGFSRASFPAPPARFGARGLPIVIELKSPS